MSETAEQREPPRASTPSARRGKRRRWPFRIALLVLAGLAVVALVRALMPKPIPVVLGEVQRGAMQVTIEEEGRTRVRQRYVVSAPVSGELRRISLDPGDAVEAGSVVAVLLPTAPPLLDERSRESAESRISSAEAAKRRADADAARARVQLDLAKKELERYRVLEANRATTPEEMDRREADVRSAEATLRAAEMASRAARFELETARAALLRDGAAKEGVTVLAPISGRILAVRERGPGAVTQGTPLVEIGDPSALEVVVDLLTRDAVEVASGASALLSGWGGSPIPARVRLVEPSAFTEVSALGVEEQRVNVLLDFDAPPERWAALGDGFRVEAAILVWSAPEVVKAPASALFRHAGGWAAFAVEGGRARLRAVEIGHRTPSVVEVLSGLDHEMRVVLHPSDEIGDGARVVER